MTQRGRGFLRLFSLCTAVNVFLLYKIHFTGNLRDSWRSNYVEPFCAGDIPVLLLLFLVSVPVCEWLGTKALPWLSGRVKLTNQGNGRDGIVMEDGPGWARCQETVLEGVRGDRDGVVFLFPGYVPGNRHE